MNIKTQIMFLVVGVCLGSAQTYRNPKSPSQWNKDMWDLQKKSAAEQAEKDKAEQARVSESNKATTDAEKSRQQEIKAEAGQFGARMRHAEWLERSTNTVPSPAKVSELYLKDLGDLNVAVETNRRSGTIIYCVSGCDRTNIGAVFDSLKQMPNRTRIAQGTNSVTVSIKLPTLP